MGLQLEGNPAEQALEQVHEVSWRDPLIQEARKVAADGSVAMAWLTVSRDVVRMLAVMQLTSGVTPPPCVSQI
jgi:hypothetical protein